MSGFDQTPLDETETVKGVFYGGRGQVGGQLIVTNRRLLFGPIDVAFPRAIVEGTGDLAGITGMGLVKGLLDAYEPLKKREIWLRHVLRVDSAGLSSLFSPPKIRLTLATEEVLEWGVVKSTSTASISKDNEVARDRCVATIRAAIAGLPSQ
jgi:hypothetical protein